MNRDVAFKWLLFMTFATGFVLGQEYHSGFWLVIRFLFQVAMWSFVLITLYQTVIRDNARRLRRANRERARRWMDPQSPPKTKPSSKGTVVTAAAVAQAIGTHVTVLDPEKQPASSDECRHAAGRGDVPCGDKMCVTCYPTPDHPSNPGFKPNEG